MGAACRPDKFDIVAGHNLYSSAVNNAWFNSYFSK